MSKHPKHVESALDAGLEDQLADLWFRDGSQRVLLLQQLVAQHPEHAEALRHRVADLEALERSAVRTASLPPGTPERIGARRILGVLGQGASATVYLASQQQPFERLVAVKLLRHRSPRALARFQQEVDSLAAMSHENVARVLDCGEHEGELFVVLELVPGAHHLVEYCRSHSLTLVQRLGLFHQVCRGVQHAHQRGILHRDIKPQNVLVSTLDGIAVPKVIDFGLARAIQRDPQEAMHLTREGALVGTLGYMSPEQARGIRDIDARTDVYSLGALLYELLTGRAPLDAELATADGDAAALEVIGHADIRSPSSAGWLLHGNDSVARDLARDLDIILLTALRRDRDERYGSVQELSEDIDRCLAHEPLRAGHPGIGHRLAKFVRRNRVAVATGSVVAAALVTSTLVSLSYARETEERSAELAMAATSLRQRTDEFDLLANVVHVRKAREAEAGLHPATPAMAPGLKAWLEVDLARLQEARPRLVSLVDGLSTRALPMTSPQRDRLRAAHADWAQVDGRLALARALTAARAVTMGQATVELPGLPDHLAQSTALGLVVWVFPRLGWRHERQGLGEEPLTLAAALRARELLESGDRTAPAYLVMQRLAAANMGVGDIDASVAAAKAMVPLVPESARAMAEEFVTEMASQRAYLSGDEVLARVAELEREAAGRTEAIDAGLPREFALATDRFLFDAMRPLLVDLDQVCGPVARDVTQRLAWAEAVEPLTLKHPKATVSWEQARAAVAASDRYRGGSIDLQPQLGLVPIGANPVTGLWEFYDLRSAWDPEQGIATAGQLEIPRHDPNGHLEVGKDTGIVFVLVPGGTFHMGAQRNQQDRTNHDPRAADTEGPVHRVTLAPYFLARHETTQYQFARLAQGLRPSRHGARQMVPEHGIVSDANPVESVDWEHADRVLREHGLVLPTEAQWEYAARAGTTSPWWTGADPRSLEGAANLLDRQVASSPGVPAARPETWLDDGFHLHGPVDALRPNAWGFHHMTGNVVEWVREREVAYTQPVRAGDGYRENPDARIRSRVIRGGGYQSPAEDLRSTARFSLSAATRTQSLGFRAARPVQGVD
ncbi:MAG: hypothetical protein RL148_939 [Planctomycetota bacterium]